MSDSRIGLELLGVLIGRVSTQRKLDRVFVIVGVKQPPRIPQDMIETRPIPVFARQVRRARSLSREFELVSREAIADA